MPNVTAFITLHKFPAERFLPIKNFEGRFWVSDFGRIISQDIRKNTIKFLSPYIDSQGYRNTQLRKKPANRKCRVHQLVGEHFCIMAESNYRMTWNHKDGNKLNNHYTNLEYITAYENSAHSVSTGLHDIKGENHHNNKLTKEMVLEIRSLRKTGMIYKDIAKRFGISRKQANDVVIGRNWGWLT